jgi:hypothetical protein
MRALFFAALLCLVGACCGSALAAPVIERSDAVQRIVFLADGAVYSGDLVELQPGKQVILRLASGETRRFEWSKIRRVSPVRAAVSTQTPEPSPQDVSRPAAARQRASVAQPAPFHPPAQPTKPDAVVEPDAEDQARDDSIAIGKPALAALKLSSQLESFNVSLQQAQSHPDIVGVRISSPVPVRLTYVHDRANFDDEFLRFVMWPVSDELAIWRTACKSPCEAFVYRNADYKIKGADVTTASLDFPRRGKEFRLTIEPGSRVLRGFAWAALVLGSVSAAAGLSMLAVPGVFSGGTAEGVREALIGLNVAGIGALFLSIPFFVGSRTGYRLERLD